MNATPASSKAAKSLTLLQTLAAIALAGALGAALCHFLA
jgi:hypothetical protein